MKNKKNIKIAIDSPAAAGAGTQAKLISKYYNLFYLDTGKIYRFIANIKIKSPEKYNLKYIEKKMKAFSIKNLDFELKEFKLDISKGSSLKGQLLRISRKTRKKDFTINI